jgi:hypothetical protein
MQHRFSVGGGHRSLAFHELVEIIKHGSWKIHHTPLGKLYELDWVADEVVELLSSTVRINGNKPRRNHYASELFGIELYGDCYLHSNEELNHMVVPAVCKYERDGKTLAHQGLLKANAPLGENPPRR